MMKQRDKAIEKSDELDHLLQDANKNIGDLENKIIIF